ncbi:MAG: 3D domain-containing protein [Phycisphaerales bacterium]
MAHWEDWSTRARRRVAVSPRLRRSVEVAFFLAAGLIVSTSAILAKEATHAPVLAAIAPANDTPQAPAHHAELPKQAPAESVAAFDADTRWFDARPVRPVRTIEMLVTAYAPDRNSCGDFADGQTATLHGVTTNAGRLVAADPSVLPYGTMLSIPGYDDASVVPVLDCGGAIKGNHLDLLFPTHEQARAWGVRRLTVTIYEYADGKPAPNPRRVR